MKRGDAYRIECYYNPEQPAARALAEAKSLLRQMRADHLPQILILAEQAMELQGLECDAVLVIAQAIAMASTVQAPDDDTYSYTPTPFSKAPPQFLGDVYKALLDLANYYLEQRPDSWAFLVLAATSHYLLWDFLSAKEYFEKALKADRAETEDYPWYFAFLMTVGGREESLRLVKAAAKRHVANAMWHSLCALFLSALGLHHEARADLTAARELGVRPRNNV